MNLCNLHKLVKLQKIMNKIKCIKKIAGIYLVVNIELALFLQTHNKDKFKANFLKIKRPVFRNLCNEYLNFRFTENNV